MRSIYPLLKPLLMATNPAHDDDIIIDPSMLVEPDESDEQEDEFGFDDEEFTIEGESITDDEEFDDDWEDVFEEYEEDPSLLDEDDDL